MNDDRRPNPNVALNVHFQQTINDRIEKYEKRIDSSFECLLSRFNGPRCNGDRYHDEFNVARCQEFVKKVTAIRDIIRREFRSDLAELIKSKYSNDMNTFDREFTEESFGEMLTLFNRLKLEDSSEVHRETYSEVIELFERLKISGQESSDCDVIEISEGLMLSSIGSTKPDESSDQSEDDVFVDVEESTSDDSDLICENDADMTIGWKKINMEIIDSSLEEESTSDNEDPASIASFISDEDEVFKFDLEIPELDAGKINESIEFCPETYANDRKKAALAFANFLAGKRLITLEKELSEEELNCLYDTYAIEVNPEVSIVDQVLESLRSIDIIKHVPLSRSNNEVEFKETFFLNRIQESQIRPDEMLVPFKGEVLRTLNLGYLTRLAKFRCPICKDCFTAQDKFDEHNVSEMHILKTIYSRERNWFKKDVDYLQINGIPDLTVKRDETTTCEISCVNTAQDGSKIYISKIFELVYSGVETKIEYGSNYCLEKGDSFKVNITAKYTSIVTNETLYPIVLRVFKDDVSEYNYILIEPHFKVGRESSFLSRGPRATFPTMSRGYRSIPAMPIDCKTIPATSKDYRPPLKTQDENNNKRCIIAERGPPESLRQISSNGFDAFHSTMKIDRIISTRGPSEPRRPITSRGSGAFHSTIKIDRTPSTDSWRMKKEVPIYNPPKNEKKPICIPEKKEKEEILEAPRIARAIQVPKMRLDENSIPKFLNALIKFKFKTSDFQWTVLEKHLLAGVRKLICEEGTLKLQHNKDALSERNYIQRLHNMMWIEEYQALEEIRSYGQTDIDLLTDKLNENLVGISLPNLSEGRPSLLKGDFITVIVKSSKFENGIKKCEGNIQLIEEKAAYAKLHKTFYTEKYWIHKVDVEFRFNRTPLKMSHTALDSIRGVKWQESLFPQTFERNPNSIKLRPFFNESINQNELQIQAITNIVQNRAFPAPYILFGPPGTGKTATLVESIVQIWSTMESSRICVCASSNTAADVIAKRLLQYIPLTEVIRVYGLSRNDADIISELQGCCNYDARVKEVYFPCLNELKRKRIVIMTPVTAGRFILNGITFDYIFMDEAGHALEVDVLIPFSGFLRNAQCGLVLAGDPKQLGPVVRSPYAIALGYGMSLLERLMTQCDIYKKDPISGKYNHKVITKLVNNYRSHEMILRVPNEQFYEKELRAEAPKEMIHSLCQWKRLPAKGFPIIFHSVKGKEERENNSPSYFNSSEVDVVAKYVDDLFRSKEVRLEPSEVGIISPYRKQVQKIRQRLHRSWPKINVASVEEFQGQERKVIIISTVRSRQEHLATDYKYGLGFLKNEKRFNVAITRAIALLVVIGNPDILQCDPHWREFLKYCTENSAFVGEPASGSVPDDFDPNTNQDMYLKGFRI